MVVLNEYHGYRTVNFSPRGYDVQELFLYFYFVSVVSRSREAHKINGTRQRFYTRQNLQKKKKKNRRK